VCATEGACHEVVGKKARWGARLRSGCGVAAASSHAGAASLSAGTNQSCAVKSDGSVVCWGYDSVGQARPPSAFFNEVSSRTGHSCAVLTSGNLSCWGGNANGESTPIAGAFARIGAGDGFNCAIRNDGTLACWGSNAPPGIYRDIDSGPYYACALDALGGETCWGEYARQAFVNATVAAVPMPSWAGLAGSMLLLGVGLGLGRRGSPAVKSA
jgi:hypothetical protein